MTYHRCRNRRPRSGVFQSYHRCERTATVQIGEKMYCDTCAVVVAANQRARGRGNPPPAVNNPS